MKLRKMKMPEVFERGHRLAVWHVEQCCGVPDRERWAEHLDLFERRNRESMSDFDMVLAVMYAESALRYGTRHGCVAKPEVKRWDGAMVKCGLWAGRIWGNVTESEAA